MRYKASWLKEVERYTRCCPVIGAVSTTVGLQQFADYENEGVVPTEPDRYFTALLDGKRWWEWTVNEYAKLQCSGEWWGWEQLRQDFAGDDAGFKQVKDRCEAGHLWGDDEEQHD